MTRTANAVSPTDNRLTKQRKPRTDLVYFTTAVPIGTMPQLKKAVTKRYVDQNERMVEEVIEAEVSLSFRNDHDFHYMGRTRGYNPLDPEDAYQIAEIRAAIANPKDDRVRQFGLCELHPTNIPEPLIGWNGTTAHELVGEVKRISSRLPEPKRTEWLKQCILYEDEHKSHGDELVAEIEEILDGPVNTETLSVEL